jgi:hypothetical protein
LITFWCSHRFFKKRKKLGPSHELGLFLTIDGAKTSHAHDGRIVRIAFPVQLQFDARHNALPLPSLPRNHHSPPPPAPPVGVPLLPGGLGEIECFQCPRFVNSQHCRSSRRKWWDATTKLPAFLMSSNKLKRAKRQASSYEGQEE